MGKLIAVPETSSNSACVLVFQLPGRPRYAITALNFGHKSTEITIDLPNIDGLEGKKLQGKKLTDIVSDQTIGSVSSTGSISIPLHALSGRTISFTP